MKISNVVRTVLAATILLASVTVSADEYSFKVINGTRSTIKKLLVSEDGETYGYFDIGSGIKARQTVELVWDSSTNSESCEQYVKAVFADGSESEAAMFDFCEEDLVLEF